MLTTIKQIALAAAAVSVVMLNFAGAQAADNWRAYHYFSSATHPAYVSLENLAAEIEKHTPGIATVKANVGGSLPIEGTRITQAVGEGIVDLAYDGFYQGNVPIASLTGMPGLAITPEEYAKAVTLLQPYLEKELDRLGVKLLAHYYMPIQVLWSNKPLTSIDQMDGSKTRVLNPNQAEFVRRLNGVPVTPSTAEVAPALQRGVFDNLITATSGGGRLWGDMLTHNYRLDLNYDLRLIIVNKASFEALPADQQQTVVRLAQEAADTLQKSLLDEEDRLLGELQDKGLVVTWPEQEHRTMVVDTMESYWDEWATSVGPDAVALMTSVREALGK